MGVLLNSPESQQDVSLDWTLSPPRLRAVDADLAAGARAGGPGGLLLRPAAYHEGITDITVALQRTCAAVRCVAHGAKLLHEPRQFAGGLGGGLLLLVTAHLCRAQSRPILEIPCLRLFSGNLPRWRNCS